MWAYRAGVGTGRDTAEDIWGRELGESKEASDFMASMGNCQSRGATGQELKLERKTEATKGSNATRSLEEAERLKWQNIKGGGFPHIKPEHHAMRKSSFN